MTLSPPPPLVQIGKLDLVAIVDSSEPYCREHMSSGQEEALSVFRNDTLPVLGHYDDQGVVVVVSSRLSSLKSSWIWAQDFQHKILLFGEDLKE